eukprot:c21554_g1_i1 orf=452-1309(+)
MSFEDEESHEHTLLVVREVSVFKILPRTSSGSYKCADWLQSDKIWTGRLRVVSRKDICEIRLEDSNSGELFAACHVAAGQREATVERVADSSRYFVLRIDDGRGKHAFIGLGFSERNEAFDFNVALSDHEKYLKREVGKERGETEEDDCSNSHPSLDLRLREGETIRINVKTKPSSTTGMISSAIASGGTNLASTGRMKAPLAPPPSGGRLRSPLPPPPNDTKPSRVGAVASVSATNVPSAHSHNQREKSQSTLDPFADLSQLETHLPASATESTRSGGVGWAAF